MYPVNLPQGNSSPSQGIAVNRYRTGQNLLGAKNRSNTSFATPSSEKFTHTLPTLSIQVYYNGVRLALTEDYQVAESGGSGTGFDTVVLAFAPKPGDQLFADYILA